MREIKLKRKDLEKLIKTTYEETNKGLNIHNKKQEQISTTLGEIILLMPRADMKNWQK